MLRKALCVGAVRSADDALRTSLREGAIVRTEQLERTAALRLAKAVMDRRLWTTCCITSGLSDEAGATTFIQEMAADKKDGQSFSFPMFGMPTSLRVLPSFRYFTRLHSSASNSPLLTDHFAKRHYLGSKTDVILLLAFPVDARAISLGPQIIKATYLE